MRFTKAMRSATGVTVHAGKAALAEAMAASISTISPKATWATISSVAGFSTPIRALEWGVTQAPPM